MTTRRVETLFVTGMQRSGTTLLSRLLDGHPALSILAQPFPLVFVQAKREFLRGVGEAQAQYPLDPLFPERRFTLDDFTRFLSCHRFEAETLTRVFAEMAAFDGQYTRPSPDMLDRALGELRAGGFAATVSQLYQALSSKAEAAVFGGKETICEEFIPHMLDRGAACLVIVRDPRDVFASLHYGTGARFGGRPKPALFVARHWRKSVAFALHLESHPRFAWVRYEDFVDQPLAHLNRIAGRLGLDPFTDAMAASALRDADGGDWPGNSSHTRHHGVSRGSVAAYRGLLPPHVTAYLEAVCYPELRCLGYPVQARRPDLAASMRGFVEPFPIERPGLTDYSTDPARQQEELDRDEAIRAEPTAATRPYFLFDDVRARLWRAVSAA